MAKPKKSAVYMACDWHGSLMSEACTQCFRQTEPTKPTRVPQAGDSRVIALDTDAEEDHEKSPER